MSHHMEPRPKAMVLGLEDSSAVHNGQRCEQSRRVRQRTSQFIISTGPERALKAQRRSCDDKPLVRRGESFVQYADQQLYIEFFWTSYLPSDANLTTEACQYSPLGWVSIAKAFADMDAVRSATAALSLCMLGTQHKEPSMIANGFLMYGRTLKQMQGQLYCLNGRRRDGIQVVARLLGLFAVRVDLP